MNKEKTYTVESYAPNQIIFNEGDESKYAYLVQSGSVEIFRIVNNNHVIINKIKQGELFGEMGIVSSEPRVASAKAAEKCRLIKFDQEDVLSDLQKSPKTVNALTHLLIKRFEILDNELREQHGTDIFLKTAYLLELLSSDPEVGHMIPYKTLATRAKQILNASKIEIDSAINRLLKLNLIKVEKIVDEISKQEKHRIEILNPESFTQIAKTYYETMTKKDKERDIGGVAFIDISELADRLSVSPDRISNKLRSGNIPPDIIYFHKESTEKWLSQKTRETFDN